MNIEKLDSLIDISTECAIRDVTVLIPNKERTDFLFAIAELIKARAMVSVEGNDYERKESN